LVKLAHPLPQVVLTPWRSGLVNTMALRTLNSECAYTVRSGDTLAAIAADFGVSIPDLRDANGLGVGAQISAAQRLFIPGHTCLVQPVIVATGTYGGRRWGGGGWHGGNHHGHHGGGGHHWNGGGTHMGSGGMHGLADASAVPTTPVPMGSTVKVQFNAAGATASQLEAFKSTLLAFGYAVTGLDGPGWLSPVVSVLMTQSLIAPGGVTLRQYAQAAFNAAMSVGIVTQGTAFTAGIYTTGSGSPVGGSVTPIMTGAGVPATAVNPGDQVKVQLYISRFFPSTTQATESQRASIAQSLGASYRVLGIDLTPVNEVVSILVQAPNMTTLAAIASAANYAVSSAGLSVSQSAGGVTAAIYQRATPGAYVPPAGVPDTLPPSGGGVDIGGLFDSAANAIGLSTGLPLTGAVVAGIAVIGLIILLKT